MVEIKAPVKLKDLEVKLGVLFKLLMGEVFKKEHFDTGKMIAINLKREESIVLMDRDDDIWELSRNKKGHYHLKRLRQNTDLETRGRS